MPATTPAQQRLMGQAYAIKTGKMNPEDLDPEYKDQIVKLADSMTKKQLEDFAKTKHSEMKENNTYQMKNMPTFEQFVNESLNEAGDLAYWKQYEKGTAHGVGEENFNKKVAKNPKELEKLYDEIVHWWDNEAETDGHGLPFRQRKVYADTLELALDYLKKFRSINGNIIDAMISQSY